MEEQITADSVAVDLDDTAVVDVSQQQKHLPYTFSRRYGLILERQQEQSATSAMSDVQGLGSELDLHRLVDEIQEPEDLLESADDAPIIRLINALLTEAIRNNASVCLKISAVVSRWRSSSLTVFSW